MSPLALICLILLVALFLAGPPVIKTGFFATAWKERPVLMVSVMLVLVALMVLFGHCSL